MFNWFKNKNIIPHKHRWISNKERFEERFGKNSGSLCSICNTQPDFCKICDIPKCKCNEGWPLERYNKKLYDLIKI